jgi:hypothetical protein
MTDTVSTIRLSTAKDVRVRMSLAEITVMLENKTPFIEVTDDENHVHLINVNAIADIEGV